jgi:hypothetical protein
MNNKIICEKCHGLSVTLGWSARPQITRKGSGKILGTAYTDRLLNDDFYPLDKTPHENIDEWPTCPECAQRLPAENPGEDEEELFNIPVVDLGPARLALLLLFIAFLVALITF